MKMEHTKELERQLRGFGLVSAALGTFVEENKVIETFTTLMDVDFLAFAHQESAINDLVADRQLRDLLAEMRQFAHCPALHSRTIGAIGGGFSAGKSAFINSLLDASAGVKLAEGINPVTAIPSYVLQSDTEIAIQGINNKGASFKLDTETYKGISHDLLKQLPYLRDIMPYIIVSAPMVRDGLDRLCFIDTPGYNPAAVGQAESDAETAREYIKDASFLIWMVGLDTNGTIPQSDLDFLSKLGFGETDGRPLYVVANKAELKPVNQVEDILDVFVECLEDSGMQFAGITAYSSRGRKVIASRGKELFEFLSDNNFNREHYTNLMSGLCKVLRPYVEEIFRDDNKKKRLRKAINGLMLDALRIGVIDAQEDGGNFEQRLLSLERDIANFEKLEVRLERVKALFDRFKRCIDDFADELEMSKVDVSDLISVLFAEPVLASPSHLQAYEIEGDESSPVMSRAAQSKSKNPVRKVVQKKTSKKPAKKVVKKTTKKPSKKVVKKTTKKPLKRVVKKPAAMSLILPVM